MINKQSGGEALSTVYKRILIVGEGITITPKIEEQYNKDGYLLIGDGKTLLNKIDFSILQGKVDPNTRIDILAHGAPMFDDDDDSYVIDSAELKPKILFQRLANFNPGVPLNIHLHACYAGIAASNVNVLPVGSVLVAHSPENETTSTAVSAKTITESIQEFDEPSKSLGSANPVLDFIQRFDLNVKQTATISIKKSEKEGDIFKHTIHHPEGIITTPEESKRYLEFCRQGFIDAYEKEFNTKINVTLPEITMEQAEEWRNDNFYFRAMNGSKKLTQALKENKDAFNEYVNHTINEGPVLHVVIQNRRYNLLPVLLESEYINIIVNESGILH